MKIESLTLGMMEENCYIIQSQAGNAAIVDPGDKPEQIIAAVTRLGVQPKMILLTHGHFDHIGAVKALKAEYPAIQVYASADELPMLRHPEDAYGPMRAAILGHDQLVIEPDVLLHDGDTITLDEVTLQVLATPGHSKGSVCYLCEGHIFAGDTLFLAEIGRVDLFGGSMEDMNASLRRLKALPGDYEVHCGHGPDTTLSYERTNNPYMRSV